MVPGFLLFSGFKRGISGFQVSENRYTIRYVANSTPYRRYFWTVLVFLAVFHGVKEGGAQQPETNPLAASAVKLSEIPERFFLVQDKLGYFWQAFGNGALVSGETQYLQSGLNLIIDGTPFDPIEAKVREPATGEDRIDIHFIEKRTDSVVSRDLWFDPERSGVRVLDTFSNTSKIERKFSIFLRTTYPFSWQSLHGSGGALLSSDPGLQLNPADYSLGVHFSPSEGRHDTFFLLGSEKSAQKPELKASPNSRELTFSYAIVVPPGESRSLVHWILQRNLADVSRDVEATAPFFQRGRLIQPGIESADFPRVVNFDPSAFQVELAATAQLKSLVALNDMMDRFGFHRRGEDLLWVSPTNQVSGAVARDSILTVSTPFEGEMIVKTEDVAAIRGRSGSRQSPLIYLRNGGVLSGEVTKGELAWAAGGVPGGTLVPGEMLDPNSVNLLLLATGPSDGVPPPQATHFLQLNNGSVIPVKSSASSLLRFNTPWGTRQSPLSDVLEVAHTLLPHPHYRVILRSGFSVTAFLNGESIPFESVSGKAIEVAPAAIARIWTAGAVKLFADSFSETWLDFSEFPDGVGPTQGFLVSGNSLIDGGFADETLFLSDRGGVVKVETAQIKGMRRSDEPEDGNLLEVDLLSGDKIVGELTAYELRILSDGGELVVPADQVLAYWNKAN